MPDIIEFIQPVVYWIIRRSLEASLLVGVMLALQFLLRHRINAQWRYALWLLLLIRLSFPWSPSSALSIYNIFPRESTDQNVMGGIPIEINNRMDSQFNVQLMDSESMQQADVTIIPVELLETGAAGFPDTSCLCGKKPDNGRGDHI